MKATTTRQHHVRVGNEAHRLLKELSERTGDPMSAVLDRAIEHYWRVQLFEEAGRQWAAIQADPSSALAHFAAFCNRGKRLQMAGFSFGAFGEVRRLRREIDRALVLAPDWPEALAGKGALLVALPRLLGGDVEEGERLLKRALTLDPTNVEARIILQELESDACAAGTMIAQVGFPQ